MTTSVAVEMDKPIRRGFALGESSGQWENGTANAQVIGTISPLLAEASPFSSHTDCELLEMCTGWMIKIFSKVPTCVTASVIPKTNKHTVNASRCWQ